MLQNECASHFTGRNRETCMAACKHVRAPDDRAVAVGGLSAGWGGAVMPKLWRGARRLCFVIPMLNLRYSYADSRLCLCSFLSLPYSWSASYHSPSTVRYYCPSTDRTVVNYRSTVVNYRSTVVKIRVAHAPARDHGWREGARALHAEMHVHCTPEDTASLSLHLRCLCAGFTNAHVEQPRGIVGGGSKAMRRSQVA